jgi:hypothetical protein
MQDLRLIGVHEDGEHLLLAGDGEERFRLPIDDQLRADVRQHRPARSFPPEGGEGSLRPRDVQALVRGGASAEEAAERAGWPVEKVHRYEGPILAEREHIAGLARRVSVRGRTPGGAASVQTVEARVSARLVDRGVPADAAQWDAWRRETGPWTVVATFPAGGRERRASWHFDPVDRALTPLDDEARWLSGDEQEPVGGPIPTGPRRKTRVYDVEAEGGLRPAAREQGAPGSEPAQRSGRGKDTTGGAPADSARSSHEEPVDLMTAMRERSAARGRRSGRRGKHKTAPPTSPAHVPGAEEAPDDALPLEDIAYDPATMPLPPGAHVAPEAAPELADAGSRAEDEAAEDRSADVDSGATTSSEPVSELGRRPTAETEPGEQEPTPARFEEPGLFDPDEAGGIGADDAPEADAAEAEPLEAVEADTDAADGDAADGDAADGPGKVASVVAEVEQPEPAPQSEPEPARAKPRRSSRRGGRPSVPSWDDIMFGAPRGDA